MRTVTHMPRSWHSRTVIRMSSLTFFRHDWRSAWIVIINPFVVVCRRYLSIGEDAWLQPKRMTILHAFCSPLYHCQCLANSEYPEGFWNGAVVQLMRWMFLCCQQFWCTKQSKHAQESTISVCLLYGNYSDSCLQSDIFCTFGVDTTPRNTVRWTAACR